MIIIDTDKFDNIPTKKVTLIFVTLTYKKTSFISLCITTKSQKFCFKLRTYLTMTMGLSSDSARHDTVKTQHVSEVADLSNAYIGLRLHTARTVPIIYILKGAEANLYTFREKSEFEGIQICFCTLYFGSIH